MSARDVIADCLKQLRRPGARTTDAGDAAFVTAALAAAGYVVVPREPTAAMLDAARDWSCAKYGKPVGNDGACGCWHAMVSAAEAEAEEASAEQTSLTVPQQRTLDKALRRSVKFVGAAEPEAKETGDE